MVYGYIRVSSDKQTVENQRFEINKFCEKQNIVINDWIEETISGTRNYTKDRRNYQWDKELYKETTWQPTEESQQG